MNEKRTGLFENGLIWFGAGVSIAEILTGTYLAPLGMGKGLAAILIGHIIGCLMLFLAGVIGGRVRKSAMETVKMSFGQKGSILFAVLNVLQLVGWTAIMIYDGALAADGVMHTGRWIWCLVIGVLIILWIVIGITNLGKINTVAMAALFLLSLILSKVIFAGGGAGAPSDDSMTFGAAVELAVAMPLSWLPLISDYTREAKEPVKATAISAVVYGIVSCWMYVIGMGAAIITGEYDIAQIMLKAGLGIAGLLIIVFSTVTTTFLDAYSAGISSETVVSKWNGKSVQEKQERQVAEKQDSRVEASRAANVTKGDNDKAVKKVVSSMQTEKNKATTKAKKPSIHERLEINKRKIQEKQGKDDPERGADRDVRTV